MTYRWFPLCMLLSATTPLSGKAQDTSRLRSMLLGAWHQDFRTKANGSLFTRPGHPGVRKDISKGYRLHFRPDFMTDDHSPSGEKIVYRLQADSVVVLAEKYYLKIEKLTADSLVYRMAFRPGFPFNEKPHSLVRYHCHKAR